MSYFAKNATEEALKEIAMQMRIDNVFKISQELYNQGAVTKEAYIAELKKIAKIAV